MKRNTEITQFTQAHDNLRKVLKPGDTVYTVLRHVSASGMSRRISLLIGSNDGSIRCIDWEAEQLGIAKRRKNKEGLVINGCGMDMGFALVYALSSTIFPGEKPYESFSGQGEGYALYHRWISGLAHGGWFNLDA